MRDEIQVIVSFTNRELRKVLKRALADDVSVGTVLAERIGEVAGGESGGTVIEVDDECAEMLFVLARERGVPVSDVVADLIERRAV